ncbi:MAG TPA: response regulator [Hanamia sp.]|nr:response regulator [Hanamia sp.]
MKDHKSLLPDKKIKVLIIDDEEDFCQVIAAFLKKKGYNSTIRHTLSSGLHELEILQPQILFLDNHLPDGRGWNCTEELLKKYPSLHINLISAYKDNLPTFPSDQRVKVLEKPLSLRQVDELLSSLTFSPGGADQ